MLSEELFQTHPAIKKGRNAKRMIVVWLDIAINPLNPLFHPTFKGIYGFPMVVVALVEFPEEGCSLHRPTFEVVVCGFFEVVPVMV